MVSKYRVVEYKNGFGNSIYRISVREFLIFWQYIRFDASRMLEFYEFKDAMNHIQKLKDMDRLALRKYVTSY